MMFFSVFFHPWPPVSASGGAEKRFIETLKIFKKKGVDVTVVEPKPSLLAEFGVPCKRYELPIPIYTSGKKWFGIYIEWILWTLRACVRCLFIVRGQKYDVILAPNNTAPNLIPAYFIHLISHLPLCTIVHHIDLLSPNVNSDFPAVYRTYKKIGYDKLTSFLKTLAFFVIIALLKRSDVCITVSSSTAEALARNGVSEKRIYVSGNGVDIIFIDGFKFEGNKSYDGVFVGRIAREKGVFDLVLTWRKIVQMKRDARLVIIGSGPDIEEVRRMVRELNLEKNIIVKGRCSEREMYTLMKASRVFVFPSVFEGWGLAIAEALACGLPAVCYDIPALREVFSGCSSVFFVPAGDIEMLASITVRILKMSKVRDLAEASKTYIKRFDWRQVVERDLQIINLACRKKSWNSPRMVQEE